MDKFTQLLADLNSGALTPTHLQIAYRNHIKENINIADNIKDILTGP